MGNGSLKPEYLSKDRLETMRAELDRLKTERRAEVAQRLEFAKSLGDLSENAEYHEAREEQAWLEDEILRLEDIVRRAVVVQKKPDGAVQVGSVVTLEKEGASGAVVYTIVGSAEADLAARKLSFESPIGTALMGAHAGESVTVETPNGTVTYVIKSVT